VPRVLVPRGQPDPSDALAGARPLADRSSRTRRAGVARGLEHLLRRLGTGFLFAVFGVGAVVLASVVIPLTTQLSGRREAPGLAAQRIIHRAFRLFIWLGSGLGLFALSESGSERLRQGPGLVVANHPTLLDVVFLISCMPQADCIVKRDAWRNPFLRGIVAAAGYIPNDGGRALIEACGERLQAGRSVVLFPEGSRSPERGLRRFQRGAAHLALETGCPITPVVITCEPPALGKGQPWYAGPNRRLEFSLIVGEPMRAKELLKGDVSSMIAARQVTAALRDYFVARVGRG
jgi:1-acyl-sn-glycerol-3-phosphate acyltransferase